MRQERNAIARKVALQLWEAERTNDLAMASTARLIAVALESRLDINAAACVGHSTVEILAATIDRQTASRKLLIEAHAELSGVCKSLRLDERAFGGGADKEVPRGAVVEMPVQRAA